MLQACGLPLTSNTFKLRIEGCGCLQDAALHFIGLRLHAFSQLQRCSRTRVHMRVGALIVLYSLSARHTLSDSICEPLL